MIDLEDMNITIEPCGKRRFKYMCYCKKCHSKLGYRRKSAYNKSGLCRQCSQRKVKATSKQEMSKYPNVNFNDKIIYRFKKVKSRGAGERVHYRVNCKFCGRDKGYVRRSLFNTRCYKCTMTKDRKIKISAQQQGISVNDWKGYISPENTRIRQSEKGREWRYNIMVKANFTCDITKQQGIELHVHHLYSFNSYPEKRFELDNGVCLCKDLHKEFHSIYGKGNNTKEQYEEFKKAKLEELGLDKI